MSNTTMPNTTTPNATIPSNPDSEAEDNPRRVSDSPRSHSETVTQAKERMGDGSDGIWNASQFSLPPGLLHSTPTLFFPQRPVSVGYATSRFVVRHRYAHMFDGSRKVAAIFVSGVCPNGSLAKEANGIRTTGGACAFIINSMLDGITAFPLELKGPDGEIQPQSYNRAPLRGALAALQFTEWASEEGWERLVLMTDSRYLHQGATTRLRKWAKDGSMKPPSMIPNQDLWKALSDRMGELANGGCEVSFCLINLSEDYSGEARSAAFNASQTQPQEENFTVIRRVQ